MCNGFECVGTRRAAGRRPVPAGGGSDHAAGEIEIAFEQVAVLVEHSLESPGDVAVTNEREISAHAREWRPSTRRSAAARPRDAQDVTRSRCAGGGPCRSDRQARPERFARREAAPLVRWN